MDFKLSFIIESIMLLYYPMSVFTLEFCYIYLARGKKYENESFTSCFGVSVLADEEVLMIAQCAGSLKRTMRNLIPGKQSII